MKLYLSLSSPLETEIRFLSPRLAWTIPTVLPRHTVAMFMSFTSGRACNLIRNDCADNRWKETSMKWSLGIEVLECCVHLSGLWDRWERPLKIRILKKSKMVTALLCGQREEWPRDRQSDRFFWSWTTSRLRLNASDSLNYNDRFILCETIHLTAKGVCVR